MNIAFKIVEKALAVVGIWGLVGLVYIACNEGERRAYENYTEERRVLRGEA